jgi:DnaJ homolog subfamily C member 2
LSKYRYRATPEQIKRAHRKKVLRHHPDKKAASGQDDENDNFFKCIQKATEILLDPAKRRQFDSVDEAANVDPPSKKQLSKGNFYKLWNPVFESEARFSKIQLVPMLGDESSSKEEVEAFYNFWYNFDSWRSFEYQDEDVPDDNENRDQKRHIERKNANARRKKKTEDTARLRRLVDDALAVDERIKKFRKEERAGKDKRRLEKEAEAKRLAAKKNKRVLKSSVKDVNYFSESGEASAAQVDAVLDDVELIMNKISNEELASLATRLTGMDKDAAAIKKIYATAARKLIEEGKLREAEIKTFF